MRIRILLASLLLATAAYGQEIDWPFEEGYADDLTYIHAVSNYETHPVWLERWENGLFNSNMLRVNYASVSQTELFSDVQLAINAELTDWLWFRYATDYLATQQRSAQDNQHSIGLEAYFYRNFSLYIYGNPKFEKEEIDVHYGLSWTNADRSNYLRLAYVDVAPFWDDKNDQFSENLNRPWGIAWQANGRFGRFRVFSEGRYEDGTSRAFAPPEEEAEPEDRLFESRASDDILLKLYYYRSEDAFVELAWNYYRFDLSREYGEAALNHDYDNRIDRVKLGYITPWTEKYRIRFGTHGVDQKASSTGYRAHDYHHREIIPYFFWEWFIGPGIFETGYMGSLYRWDYQGQADIDEPESDGYIDKVQLAYTLDFKGRAYLKIGISQMASLSGFGGGNVQFFMDF